MSKKFLITRPEHDDTTHYLSHWAQKIVKTAEMKGIQVFDLQRENASKEKVEGLVKKQQPGLVMFNGHGKEDIVMGHKNAALIKADSNDALLSQKITYALSCKSGKVLGKKSVEKGAKAYIGYEEDFIFFYNPKKITRPTEDETAALFLEPSNDLMISLLKENTVENACEKAKRKFKENIRRLLSSEASREETTMARFLWWDVKHLQFAGDKDAVF